MNEQKWTVLKDEDRIWWLVVQPCDICRYNGILECWDVHSHHSTWTEAMQEANRMSHTMTVTLPSTTPDASGTTPPPTNSTSSAPSASPRKTPR